MIVPTPIVEELKGRRIDDRILLRLQPENPVKVAYDYLSRNPFKQIKFYSHPYTGVIALEPEGNTFHLRYIQYEHIREDNVEESNNLSRWISEVSAHAQALGWARLLLQIKNPDL